MLRRFILEPIELAREIVDVLAERKGEDIVLIDIKELTVVTDYFVICSGTSFRMLQALSNAVKEHLRTSFRIRTRPEGESYSGWILADYGAVVLHIFSHDQREFYDLEELWSEGKVLVRMQ